MDDIRLKSVQQLKEELKLIGIPEYRAIQVFEWLKKGVSSFDEMMNIPKILRETLKEKYYITNIKIAEKYVSKIDGTVKYLFEYNDGCMVEAVVMSYHHGYTMCISTQVGCKMGCTFCATGKGGFKRNLTATEILAQIYAAEKDLSLRISNLVLMGMGEPLDNYENVVKFLKIVSSEESLNIGMRHISLSTCGLVDKIYALEKEGLGLTLSVSLHAPTDEIRNKTMPINKKWKIKELIQACRFYSESTRRRISFEYAMISGVNDSNECANQLGMLLKGMLCHVNLIPVNTVQGTGYKKSDIKRQQTFIKILQKYGITATVRRTMGSDINASCGQLAGKARRTKNENIYTD